MNATLVSIRARPIDRAIRARLLKAVHAKWFQSAPDQLIGRYPWRDPKASPCSCFNPRPTN